MSDPTRTQKGRSSAAEKLAIRRKTLKVDQDKLDRAVEILGSRSEADAIDQALDLLVFREELRDGIDRIAGKGGREGSRTTSTTLADVRTFTRDDEAPAG